ncbi:hypothetical protein IGI53_000315 [Enterococcus sp. DIV0788_1]
MKKKITLFVVLILSFNVLGSVLSVPSIALAEENEIILIENEQLALTIDTHQSQQKNQWRISYQKKCLMPSTVKFRTIGKESLAESAVEHRSLSVDSINKKTLVETLKKSKSRWYEASNYYSDNGTFEFETDRSTDILTFEFQLDQKVVTEEEKKGLVENSKEESVVQTNTLSRELSGPYVVQSTKEGPQLLANETEELDEKPIVEESIPVLKESSIEETVETSENIFLGNKSKSKEMIQQEWEEKIRTHFNHSENLQIIMEEFPDYVESPRSTTVYQGNARVIDLSETADEGSQEQAYQFLLQHTVEVEAIQAGFDVLIDGSSMTTASPLEIELLQQEKNLVIAGSKETGKLTFENLAIGVYSVLLKNVDMYELPEKVFFEVQEKDEQIETQLFVDDQAVPNLELISKHAAVAFRVVNELGDPLNEEKISLQSEELALTAKSDENGIAHFENLPLGQYAVNVSESADYQGVQSVNLSLTEESLQFEVPDQVAISQPLEKENDLTQEDVQLVSQFKPYRFEINSSENLVGQPMHEKTDELVVMDLKTSETGLTEFGLGDYVLKNLTQQSDIQLSLSSRGEVKTSSEQLKVDSASRVISLDLIAKQEPIPTAEIKSLNKAEIPETERGFLPETGGQGMRKTIQWAILFILGGSAIGGFYLWLNRKEAH